MTLNSAAPLLLVRLWATIDDESIFDMGGLESAADFKDECREIFEQLYNTAYLCWRNSYDPMCDWHVPHPGAALVEHYGPLHSCWIRDFTTAIRTVAEQADFQNPDDQEFCNFMLGVLWCGWREYIRKLHARPLPASAA